MKCLEKVNKASLDFFLSSYGFFQDMMVGKGKPSKAFCIIVLRQNISN